MIRDTCRVPSSGRGWYLAVDGGILRCRVPGIVTFETDGVVYALSGNAEAFALGKEIVSSWPTTRMVA